MGASCFGKCRCGSTSSVVSRSSVVCRAVGRVVASFALRPRVDVAWVLGLSSVLVLRSHVVTALSVLLSHCLCFALRASFLHRSQCSVPSKVLDPGFYVLGVWSRGVVRVRLLHMHCLRCCRIACGLRFTLIRPQAAAFSVFEGSWHLLGSCLAQDASQVCSCLAALMHSLAFST